MKQSISRIKRNIRGMNMTIKEVTMCLNAFLLDTDINVQEQDVAKYLSGEKEIPEVIQSTMEVAFCIPAVKVQNYEEVIELLREVKEERALTYKDLEEMTGCNYKTVQRYIKDGACMPADIMIKLINMLGFSITIQ